MSFSYANKPTASTGLTTGSTQAASASSGPRYSYHCPGVLRLRSGRRPIPQDDSLVLVLVPVLVLDFLLFPLSSFLLL